MKKIIQLLLILVLLIAAFIFYLSRPVPSQPPIPPPSTASDQTLDQLVTIEFQSQMYHYAYAIIPDLTRLRFFSNHVNQASSADLLTAYSCSILINGNFYDTKDQPLGWQVSQGKTLSPSISSALFNGFFSLIDNQPNLSITLPESSVDLGLQSGPLLILDSRPLNLNLTSDQPRRRMVLALNDQAQIIFFTLIGSNSPFSGPLLEDTPGLLLAIAAELHQNLVSALNLDGGSASAFHSGSVHLPEYSHIGSFFCYNDSI